MRCGYQWVPRSQAVKICPSCKSKHWSTPRPSRKVTPHGLLLLDRLGGPVSDPVLTQAATELEQRAARRITSNTTDAERVEIETAKAVLKSKKKLDAVTRQAYEARGREQAMQLMFARQGPGSVDDFTKRAYLEQVEEFRRAALLWAGHLEKHLKLVTALNKKRGAAKGREAMRLKRLTKENK